MPLKTSASPEAFSSNVSTEMHAGRPQAQSIAIAYSKRREAMRRRQLWRGGYADGGSVAPDMAADDLHLTPTDNTSGEPHTDGLDEMTHPMEFMAAGGMVGDEDEDDAYLKEDYDMPGSTTADVVPGTGMDFHRAIKRRQRRFVG